MVSFRSCRADGGAATACRFAHRVVRAILGHAWEIPAHGADPAAPRGAAILSGNDASFVDPLRVGMALGRPVWFVGREELIRRLHADPVRRDHPECPASSGATW